MTLKLPPIDVHILTFNEQDILPYTLRHYATFARRIVVHDSFSTDNTRDICRSFGATIKDWDTGGKLNDPLAADLKNNCWKGTDATWVICVDADELVYFPRGVEFTLHNYMLDQVAVVKPCGFELFSETFPTTNGQIYDEVKMGASDDKWYAKPALFSPVHVQEIGYGMGAHDCLAQLKSGQNLRALWLRPQNPATYLLHCKHLGPVERVARYYDEKRPRLSDVNVANRWGNFDPGLKHAMDKRATIKHRLERVIS